MADAPSFGETVLERVTVDEPKPRKRGAHRDHTRDKTPATPREARALKALVTGEAKSVSAALRIAGFNPNSHQVRERLGQGGALQQLLNDEMESVGLGRKVTLCNLLKHLDARKTQTVAGEAIETSDNDAQLRAIENVIKLQERAGMIPAAAQGEGGSGQITVNVMNVNITESSK